MSRFSGRGPRIPMSMFLGGQRDANPHMDSENSGGAGGRVCVACLGRRGPAGRAQQETREGRGRRGKEVAEAEVAREKGRELRQREAGGVTGEGRQRDPTCEVHEGSKVEGKAVAQQRQGCREARRHGE